MKGQQTIPTLVAIVLVIAGMNVLLTTDNLTKKSIEHDTGDYNTIAKTKLKVEAYENRMPLELNYSGNIAAKKLGDNSGHSEDQPTWTRESIPSYGSLKSNFESEIEEITSAQNNVLGCESPSISSVSTLKDTNSLNIDMELGSANIVCESQATIVNLTLDPETITAKNPNNRYLVLAENSSNLASGISGEFPSDWSSTGSDSISCPGSISSQEAEDARNNARDNARSSAIEYSLASSLLSNFQSEDNVNIPSWISIDTDTEYSFTYRSIGDSSPQQCEYTVTTGCETNEEGVTVCDTETVDGEEFDPEYEASVTSATVEYSLSDGERQVINSEGDMETLNFDFNYTESID